MDLSAILVQMITKLILNRNPLAPNELNMSESLFKIQADSRYFVIIGR